VQGEGILAGDFVVVDPDLALEREMLVVTKAGAGSVITPYEPVLTTTTLQELATPDDPASAAPPAQILGAVYAIVRVVQPTRAPVPP